MLTASQCVQEEADSFVAKFAISVEAFPDVAASLIVRFKTAWLVVFQQQVFVVVLAVDQQFDFDEVAAGDGPKVFERNSLVLRDLLIDQLSPVALNVDLFVVAFKSIELSSHLHFQTGGLDGVFFGEVRQVRTEVDRAFTRAADFDRVRPEVTASPSMTSELSKLKRFSPEILTVFWTCPSTTTSTVMSG